MGNDVKQATTKYGILHCVQDDDVNTAFWMEG